LNVELAGVWWDQLKKENVTFLRLEKPATVFQQSMTERMLGVGDILIHSADPSLPKTQLNNVKQPEEVHEILRRAMLNARKRFRYSVHEEM